MLILTGESLVLNFKGLKELMKLSLQLFCYLLSLFLMRNILLVLFFLPLIVSAQLVINEFSTRGGYEDENEKDCDWMEIINIGSSNIDLSNYFLSDNVNQPQKWSFPKEDIAPMQLMLICASGIDKRYRVRNWRSLINESSYWRYFPGLKEPDNSWKEVTFNDNSWSIGKGGFGFAHHDDSTQISGVTSYYLRKEFFLDNEPIVDLILHADYDDAFIAYLNGVEIARSKNIYGSPPDYNVLATESHEALLYRSLPLEEYSLNYEALDTLLFNGRNILAIQVHDHDSVPKDMSGNFFLHAGINSEINSFQDPSNWFLEPLTSYHTNFKLSAGEEIIISNLSGNIIDYKEVTTDFSQISEGRNLDGIGDWGYFSTPSPGNSNNSFSFYEGISPNPQISLESGWYNNQEFVVMSCDNQAQIYYSINGDVPDTNDLIYTDTLFFNSTTVLSARSYSSIKHLPSRVIDRTFIFNEDNHNLPVFSIITDSLNLWDWDSGIYVLGPNANNDSPYKGANFWQPWSKWSRLEFFDKDREKQAEEEFDLEIHGGISRAFLQKSFRLDFKSRYTGNLKWPLISRKPYIESFNNINLRNGGNRAETSRIQDAILCQVASETNVDVMGYNPCILYLNGQYWGLYGIREKIDHHYVENNHNIDSDSVDLMNRSGALSGSDMHFIDTYHLLMNSDPNESSFLNLVEERFDIDNYIDYFITETYIQNTDWWGGYNNIKLWRPQTVHGKWRYILYDTDQAFVNSDPSVNFLEIVKYPYKIINGDSIDRTTLHSELFSHIIRNHEFRCKFSNRYTYIVNTIFDIDHLYDTKEMLKNEIIEAIPDHIDRWGSPSSLYSWEWFVDNISIDNRRRRPYALDNVAEYLDMQSRFMYFDVYPENSGVVTIESLTPHRYPYFGPYYTSDCSVNIEAIPDSGFIFSHWSRSPNDNLTFPIAFNLVINGMQNDYFIANFVKSGENLDHTSIFNIYPNPVLDYLYISLHKSLLLDIKIFNLSGYQVLDKTITSSSISLDIQSLPAGCYIIEIKGSGMHPFRKKIIKK